MSWKTWRPFGWWKKNKKPAPAKNIRRHAHFEVELLEKRWLFSTSAWLPRRPVPIGEIPQLGQDPWFAPTAAVIDPV